MQGGLWVPDPQGIGTSSVLTWLPAVTQFPGGRNFLKKGLQAMPPFHVPLTLEGVGWCVVVISGLQERGTCEIACQAPHIPSLSRPFLWGEEGGASCPGQQLRHSLSLCSEQTVRLGGECQLAQGPGFGAAPRKVGLGFFTN